MRNPDYSRSDAFDWFCDQEDLDPEDPDTQRLFDQWEEDELSEGPYRHEMDERGL